MVQKYLTKPGVRFYVLYIDFQKAFDTLDQFELFSCLNEKGMTGHFFRVLLSMYSNIKAHVKLGDEITPPILCNTGVKQAVIQVHQQFSVYISMKF